MNSEPVQYELSLLARNSATDATSDAAAVRPIGMPRGHSIEIRRQLAEHVGFDQIPGEWS